MYRFVYILFMFTFLLNGEKKTEYIALCYHDVPNTVDGDKYAVDLSSFIKQIEYLRTHHYSFISLEDIDRARKGLQPLPPKAVLLTFDDGYRTFYTNVLPLLEMYRIPATLAVVTSWLYGRPVQPPGDKYKIAPVMTPKELKSAAQSKYVEIVCHTHNQHRAVQLNPQKNTAPAVITRQFKDGLYESSEQYKKRLSDDFNENIRIISEICGYKPRAMVWPYGKYNGLSREITQSLKLPWSFTLDAVPNKSASYAVNRHLIEDNPDIITFITDVKQLYRIPDRFSFYRASLKDIYSQDPETRSKNVDEFVQKVFLLKPSALILKDLNYQGRSLYFRSEGSHEADFFSHVARALTMREIAVYPQIEPSDLKGLTDILKFSDISGVMFAEKPSVDDIKKVRYYLPEKKIIAPGRESGADLILMSSEKQIFPDGLYYADTVRDVRRLKAAGVHHIIADQPLFNLSNRDFPWIQP